MPSSRKETSVIGCSGKVVETDNLKRQAAANNRYKFIHCFMRWLQNDNSPSDARALGTLKRLVEVLPVSG